MNKKKYMIQNVIGLLFHNSKWNSEEDREESIALTEPVSEMFKKMNVDELSTLRSFIMLLNENKKEHFEDKNINVKVSVPLGKATVHWSACECDPWTSECDVIKQTGFGCLIKIEDCRVATNEDNTIWVSYNFDSVNRKMVHLPLKGCSGMCAWIDCNVVFYEV